MKKQNYAIWIPIVPSLTKDIYEGIVKKLKEDPILPVMWEKGSYWKGKMKSY